MANPTAFIRLPILGLLQIIAVGALAVNRDVSWELTFTGSLLIWDTPVSDDFIEDSPVFQCEQNSQTCELLARRFAEYL
jgi:hypothetical protein